MSDPHDTHINNRDRDDYWTTPCCYADIGNVGECTVKCPECGRTVRCWIEMHPACHASIEDVEEDEDAA